MPPDLRLFRDKRIRPWHEFFLPPAYLKAGKNKRDTDSLADSLYLRIKRVVLMLTHSLDKQHLRLRVCINNALCGAYCSYTLHHLSLVTYLSSLSLITYPSSPILHHPSFVTQSYFLWGCKDTAFWGHTHNNYSTKSRRCTATAFILCQPARSVRRSMKW